METILKSAKQTVVISPDNPITIIGERINPTGRKKMAKAIEDKNFKMIQEEAVKQVENGAHVLDVNVGVSGIDEPAMIKEAILAVSEVVDVPLCIDSASPKALAAGLEVYKGKALVNSVNAEKEKMEAVLPIVASHKAAVIGLTMGDQGIPSDAETRVKLAHFIVEQAGKRGIPAEDVIIDPLAMAISTDDQTGLQTLKALRTIRDEMGVNQTLGLSNISFGMPERMPTNAIFFCMCALNGLTCPIVDPTVWEMRRAIFITDLFMGKDEFSMNYITAYRDKFSE